MTDFQDADEVIGTIKQLKRHVLKSKENLNDILKLKEYTKKGNDDSVRFAALKALEAVFTRFLTNGDFKANNDGEEPLPKKQKTDEALFQVKKWLVSQFDSVVSHLCDMLDDKEPGIQIPALIALMSFEKIVGSKKKNPRFSNFILPRAITRLVISKNFNEQILDALRTEYAVYHDVRLNLLVTLRNLINEFFNAKEKPDVKLNRKTTCENMFLLLRIVKMPELNQQKQIEWSYFVELAEPEQLAEANKSDDQKVGSKRKRTNKDEKPALPKNPYSVSIMKFKKAFQECWVAFLAIPGLPDHILGNILRTIHVDLIPNFVQPILLMDLLSDTYDRAEEKMKGKDGNTVETRERAREEEKSLLALNGLFSLMVEHNLDYPSFFPKLYRLLTPYIVQSPHAIQFFKLLAVFLKTNLIPSYMVFAFLKRLGRLSLLAPPPVVALIVPILYNVMIYHPITQSLVHNIHKNDSSESTSPLDLSAKPLASDPFIFEETDMRLCGASESSLWELYAINNYYVPSIKALSKAFNNNFSTKAMFLINQMEDYSYQSLFEKEMKRKVKVGVPLAYKEPTTLLSEDLYPGWQ